MHSYIFSMLLFVKCSNVSDKSEEHAEKTSGDVGKFSHLGNPEDRAIIYVNLKSSTPFSNI